MPRQAGVPVGIPVGQLAERDDLLQPEAPSLLVGQEGLTDDGVDGAGSGSCG